MIKVVKIWEFSLGETPFFLYQMNNKKYFFVEKSITSIQQLRNGSMYQGHNQNSNINMLLGKSTLVWEDGESVITYDKNSN